MRKNCGSPVFIAALAAAFSALAAVPARGSASLALDEAMRQELPTALAAVLPPGASSYEGPEGAFHADTADMDGAAPAEMVLVVAGAGRPAMFLAATNEKVVRKSVKLPGKPGAVTTAFHPFAQGRTLLQVSGGADAGSVLLGWDGKDLATVWESGRPRPGESRWFEMDDLDDDGIREVVTYERSELDIATDDEIGEASSGASAENLGPTAVLRFHEGRWQEDRALLEALR